MTAIFSEGTARIRHAATGEIHEIPAEDLEWAEFASDDRQMGIEIGYSAQIEHPALGLLTWELWEYPIGAENMRETEVNGHELIENILFGLGHLPDEESEREKNTLDDKLAALPGQMGRIEQLLLELRDRSPMFGHNQASEAYRLDVEPALIEAARTSLTDIRGELAKPVDNADIETLGEAEGQFRHLARKLAALVKSATGAAGRGALAGLASWITIETVKQSSELQRLLLAVAETLRDWIHVVASL